MKTPRYEVNLGRYFRGEERGHAAKSLVVLHETVSRNVKGTADITGVAAYMDNEGLEIHAIVDIEGHVGWCDDYNAIYDHAASNGGRVNTRSVGIEQVSEVPFLDTLREKKAAWRPNGPRKKQLDTVAHWLAWFHMEYGLRLNFSQGDRPGITTHWNVSQTYDVPGGHTDCWPVHYGGYYPALYVVQKARNIVRAL